MPFRARDTWRHRGRGNEPHAHGGRRLDRDPHRRFSHDAALHRRRELAVTCDRRYAAIGAVLLLARPVVVAAIGARARAARARRTAEAPAIARAVSRLPTGDLALSGGARWLRAPSLEEPG